MIFEENRIYHVYNRGNNRQPIFINDSNYKYFLRKISKELLPYCHILAYCLMPNHFHLLIMVRRIENNDLRQNAERKRQFQHPLNRKIGTLLSSYTQAFNLRYGRSGSLFQQKTKCKKIDNGYCDILNCFMYIHQNPFKAGLSKNMDGWKFSSYREYIEASEFEIIDKDFAYTVLDLPKDKEQFVQLNFGGGEIL